MSDLVFNVAKGRIANYAALPATNDSIIVVPIMTTGIVADSVMSDYTSLSTLLAGASDEQTTMGRKTCANVTVTVDQANDRVDIDCDDITWTGATGAAISALVFVYVPDTTALNDANAVPLAKYDFVVTPNGGDITAQLPVGGFLRAS